MKLGHNKLVQMMEIYNYVRIRIEYISYKYIFVSYICSTYSGILTHKTKISVHELRTQMSRA